MFNECRPAEAVELYVGAEYIQHNPDVGDGKQSFIEHFDRMTREHPGKRGVFKRAIAEGNLVVLHCHPIWPSDLEYAGVDNARFDDVGQAVKHWDVLEELPGSSATSANGNGLF